MYEDLINAIKAVIKANGNEEITGPILQNALVETVRELGYGVPYGGELVPGEYIQPTYPVFFVAGPGVYNEAGLTTVAEGSFAVTVYDGSDWAASVFALGASSSKMDKVPSATAGNIPVFTEGGDVEDSGLSPEDFARPDGWYDGMTVGLAENLIDTKGAGSPQLIGPLRTACGNESITDEGYAVVKEIRGRSLIWNQLLTNGNFASGMTDWTVNNEEHATVSVSGGVLSGSWDGTGGNGFRQSLGEWAVGHKYYIAVTIKNALAENQRYIYIGQLSSASLEERFQPGETRRVHGVITPTSRFPGTFSVNTYSNSTFAIEMSNVVIVDLTKMYGAGNEPTADAFKAAFDRDYYPTNTGTLVNVKATGYKTVGFNQWDEDWQVGALASDGSINPDATTRIVSKNLIPVLAGHEYEYVCKSKPVNDYGVVLAYYDYAGNLIGDLVANYNSTFTPPMDAIYMRFSPYDNYGNAYQNDICIHLRWSGYNDGKYEPYKTATLDIDAIDKTATDGNGDPITPFPDGVNGIGDLSDTYDQNGGVVRFGVRAYQSGDESDATVMTDLTNTVYPLDNPVPFTWDEPFETFITPIEDFGTEEMLPGGLSEGVPVSAPMTAVIQYSTDFVREIANLPKNYLSKESAENLLSALQSAGVIASYTMTYNETTHEYDFTITR